MKVKLTTKNSLQHVRGWQIQLVLSTHSAKLEGGEAAQFLTQHPCPLTGIARVAQSHTHTHTHTHTANYSVVGFHPHHVIESFHGLLFLPPLFCCRELPIDRRRPFISEKAMAPRSSTLAFSFCVAHHRVNEPPCSPTALLADMLEVFSPVQCVSSYILSPDFFNELL